MAPTFVAREWFCVCVRAVLSRQSRAYACLCTSPRSVQIFGWGWGWGSDKALSYNVINCPLFSFCFHFLSFFFFLCIPSFHCAFTLFSVLTTTEWHVWWNSCPSFDLFKFWVYRSKWGDKQNKQTNRQRKERVKHSIHVAIIVSQLPLG